MSDIRLTATYILQLIKIIT